jgi:sugar lactone lactonase YvrE
MEKSLHVLATLAFAGLSAFAQNISTVAGGGFSGTGDGGQATSAQLSNCHGIDFDAAGNMYFTDGNAGRLRKVDKMTGIITTVAGNGSMTFNSDGIAATSAALFGPWDVAVDGAGNLYIADASNNLVRKVNASTGIINIIAGIAPTTGGPPNYGYNGDGIAATTAKIWHPNSIALDAAGNVYFADLYNNRIRKITISTGLISTVAGDGTNAYNGDGIAATSAGVFSPLGLALDPSGNIYIAEESRVRKVNTSTGLISTVAGNGGSGFSGDGGQATLAQVRPTAIALDAQGNIYITGQNRIRKITISTGIITTLAGDGTSGYNGDGIPATTAQLNAPSGVALDVSGNLYIGDAINNRIRKVDNASSPTKLISLNGSEEAIIYPNPTTGEAIISFKEEWNNINIKILDISGKPVKEFMVSGDHAIIKVNDLKKGIYFVEAFSGGKAITKQKIIID